jgi:hypothetical protein
LGQDTKRRADRIFQTAGAVRLGALGYSRASRFRQVLGSRTIACERGANAGQQLLSLADSADVELGRDADKCGRHRDKAMDSADGAGPWPAFARGCAVGGCTNVIVALRAQRVWPLLNLLGAPQVPLVKQQAYDMQKMIERLQQELRCDPI